MNGNSMPTLTESPAPHAAKVTFADVAMKLVQDGPVYAVIIVVGILAVRGTATASEAVITGLAGLLARMWPQAVQVAGRVGSQLLILVVAGVVFTSVHACAPPVASGRISSHATGAVAALSR